MRGEGERRGVSVGEGNEVERLGWERGGRGEEMVMGWE